MTSMVTSQHVDFWYLAINQADDAKQIKFIGVSTGIYGFYLLNLEFNYLRLKHITKLPFENIYILLISARGTYIGFQNHILPGIGSDSGVSWSNHCCQASVLLAIFEGSSFRDVWIICVIDTEN